MQLPTRELLQRIYELVLHSKNHETLEVNNANMKTVMMHLRIYHARYGGVTNGSKTEAQHVGWWVIKQLRKIAPVSVPLYHHLMKKAPMMLRDCHKPMTKALVQAVAKSVQSELIPVADYKAMVLASSKMQRSIVVSAMRACPTPYNKLQIDRNAQAQPFAYHEQAV